MEDFPKAVANIICKTSRTGEAPGTIHEMKNYNEKNEKIEVVFDSTRKITEKPIERVIPIVLEETTHNIKKQDSLSIVLDNNRNMGE